MTAANTQTPTWALDNLTITRNDDWFRLYTWQLANETPIDLTGYSAHAQARTSTRGQLIIDLVSAGTPDATALAAGTITLGGTEGTITLALSSTETAKLTPGTFCDWDLVLTDAGGAESTLVRGSVTIGERVTDG